MPIFLWVRATARETRDGKGRSSRAVFPRASRSAEIRSRTRTREDKISDLRACESERPAKYIDILRVLSRQIAVSIVIYERSHSRRNIDIIYFFPVREPPSHSVPDKRTKANGDEERLRSIRRARPDDRSCGRALFTRYAPLFSSSPGGSDRSKYRRADSPLSLVTRGSSS